MLLVQDSADEALEQGEAAGEDSEGTSEPAPELSYGETTLKISQLKAQIHRLESRLDSSSESSSDEEQDVRNGWLSVKADNLTAEVARLQTEAADAQEKHTAALQASFEMRVIPQVQHIYIYIAVCHSQCHQKQALDSALHASASSRPFTWVNLAHHYVCALAFCLLHSRHVTYFSTGCHLHRTRCNMFCCL